MAGRPSTRLPGVKLDIDDFEDDFEDEEGDFNSADSDAEDKMTRLGAGTVRCCKPTSLEIACHFNFESLNPIDWVVQASNLKEQRRACFNGDLQL